jgi:hypothetical protein
MFLSFTFLNFFNKLDLFQATCSIITSLGQVTNLPANI